LPKAPVQSKAYIEECQDHHQEFYALANAFREAVKAGEMPPVTQSAIDALADYTHLHFSREEEIMEKTRYSGLTDHRDRHRALNHRVKEFQKAVKTGSVIELSAVNTFIKDLTSHDREEDSPFFEHLAKHGAR